jgi:hypothetical protein
MSDDPRRSTRVLLFEEHYANLDDLRWTVDRLRRVCAALQLTEFELGAMIRMRIPDMARCLQKNRFPPPIELHLTLIERSIFPNSKPPVFPRCP